MLSSRANHLERTLADLQYFMGLKAFDLVVEEMCKEKGFKRHNGSHYYYHLIDVAQILLNLGIRDEDIITAALLHDLVEDVLNEDGSPKYNINDLENMFNTRVATIVDLVTKKKDVDYKKPENLIYYLEKISENYGAALVKTADRMHNFGTLGDAVFEKRLRQALETEQYFIPFFKECRNRYPRYAYIFFHAKTQIEPHLWAIKAHHEEVQSLKEEINNLKNIIEINNIITSKEQGD